MAGRFVRLTSGFAIGDCGATINPVLSQDGHDLTLTLGIASAGVVAMGCVQRYTFDIGPLAPGVWHLRLVHVRHSLEGSPQPAQLVLDTLYLQH